MTYLTSNRRLEALDRWLHKNKSSSNYLKMLRAYENLKVQLNQQQINEQFPSN